MWSKQLAGEPGKYGITVNCLQPGLIDTENIRPYFPVDERRIFAERNHRRSISTQIVIETALNQKKPRSI